MQRLLKKTPRLFNSSLKRFTANSPLIPLYQQSINWLEDFNPDNLIVSKMEFPQLVRKPDNILVENWHMEPAFTEETELMIPILHFMNNKYTGQCIRLDPNIFNLPLRRDIVHRVQVYESKKGKAMIHATKTLSTVDFHNLGFRLKQEDQTSKGTR